MTFLAMAFKYRRRLFVAATMGVTAQTLGCGGDFGARGEETVGEAAQAVRTEPRPTVAAAGYNFFVALQPDGRLRTWGDNVYGQLGNGNVGGPQSTPQTVLYDKNPSFVVELAELDNVVAIAVGHLQSFALRSDGTLWGWGYNQLNALGNGANFANKPPAATTRSR